MQQDKLNYYLILIKIVEMNVYTLVHLKSNKTGKWQDMGAQININTVVEEEYLG